MREIKFRAWDKKYKIMSKVSNLTIIGRDLIFTVKNGGHTIWYDDLELMQYTGLKDSQLIEEYYGDLVLASFDDGCEIFRIDDGLSAVLYQSLDNPYHTLYFWQMPIHFVIGNIYSKELLEGK